MKKTIVLLLSVATMIGCIATPLVADEVRFKATNKRMTTYYYNTYMANQAKIDFKRSPTLKHPENYKTTVNASIWLKGEDGKKRGTKNYNSYICSNYCFMQSSPIDVDYQNSPDGYCNFVRDVKK